MKTFNPNANYQRLQVNHNTIYASIVYDRTCRDGIKWYRGIYKGE